MEVAGKLLSTVKRKAAELQSGAMLGRGHSELNMAIYSQKHGAQALRHLAEHEMRVARALKEWASTEQNVCLGAVYVKLAELSQIQAQLINNLTNQHNRRRKVFKDMLTREKELDELNKDVESQRSKVTKLTKQLTQCRAARKVDMLKVEMLQVDLDKAKEIEKESTENVNKEIENHEHFKFEHIKDVLRFTLEASRQYHLASLQALEVEEHLRQLFLPDTLTSCTEDMATAAQIEAANLVNGLAESLNLSKPTSMLEKNSTLEQLIKSDRMLNNDPKYIGVPDQEVGDVENMRRPLPPPPIVDSDDSDDDYTQPYEFLTGVSMDAPPGCRPAPSRRPPNPPSTTDADYLEMYHNRSGDPDTDGILPKSLDDDNDTLSQQTGAEELRPPAASVTPVYDNARSDPAYIDFEENPYDLAGPSTVSLPDRGQPDNHLTVTNNSTVTKQPPSTVPAHVRRSTSKVPEASPSGKTQAARTAAQTGSGKSGRKDEAGRTTATHL